MGELTFIGLDVHARSAAAGALDGETGGVRNCAAMATDRNEPRTADTSLGGGTASRSLDSEPSCRVEHSAKRGNDRFSSACVVRQCGALPAAMRQEYHGGAGFRYMRYYQTIFVSGRDAGARPKAPPDAGESLLSGARGVGREVVV